MAASQVRPLRPYWIPFRILLVTVLFTLLAFVVSLFLGILGTVVWAALHRTNPHMAIAYRQIAAPFAAVVAVVVLVGAIVVEIRNYRRAKVLAGIERLS